MAPSRRIVSPLSIGLRDDVLDQGGVLLGAAEPARVRHLPAEGVLRLLRQARRASGVANRPGAIVTTRIRLVGELAGDRQGHAGDARLRRGVGGLADLPVEGGDGGGADDDAALLADGSVAAMRAAASRSTLNVPTRLTRTTRSNASSGSTPPRPSTLPGVAMPAQFTTTRSGPRASAASRAAVTAASSVTSAGAKTAALAELGRDPLAARCPAGRPGPRARRRLPAGGRWRGRGRRPRR